VDWNVATAFWLFGKRAHHTSFQAISSNSNSLQVLSTTFSM
jgi:hypothetical protein